MGRLIDSFKAYITDDATAVATDVAYGKTAYVNGGKITGTQALYTPAMMQYQGSSDYYATSALTSSGNKVTCVFRINKTSFSGSTYPTGYQNVVECYKTAIRFKAFVISNDYTSPTEWRNKLIWYVQNSAGTVICQMVSIPDVCDGENHTVFISFDGDAGTATFYIDGSNADDTGAATRTAPTTGTLGSGVSTNFRLGLNLGANEHFSGQLGYFGFKEAYLTNWQDFMDTGGNPKALDESTWTEWGGQPDYWNEHGELTNNLGSKSSLAQTGTIVVGKGGN